MFGSNFGQGVQRHAQNQAAQGQPQPAQQAVPPPQPQQHVNAQPSYAAAPAGQAQVATNRVPMNPGGQPHTGAISQNVAAPRAAQPGGMQAYARPMPTAPMAPRPMPNPAAYQRVAQRAAAMGQSQLGAPRPLAPQQPLSLAASPQAVSQWYAAPPMSPVAAVQQQANPQPNLTAAPLQAAQQQQLRPRLLASPASYYAAPAMPLAGAPSLLGG